MLPIVRPGGRLRTSGAAQAARAAAAVRWGCTSGFGFAKISLLCPECAPMGQTEGGSSRHVGLSIWFEAAASRLCA